MLTPLVACRRKNRDMLYLLDATDPTTPFPDPENAERDPDGLLAVGGDLTPARLLNAYRRGIFPWFGEHDPILWWSPDPRMVLFPDRLRISRSLAKTLRKNRFRVSFDQAFSRVIRACAGPRGNEPDTWLSAEMIQAYEQLHKRGIAHSAEVWLGDELVGGLYGIALGRIFFGESMFSRISDASKVAFVQLVKRLQRAGYELIDCQVYTQHLESLGAELILRSEFQKLVDAGIKHPPLPTEFSVSW